jgi:flagellar protein FliL
MASRTEASAPAPETAAPAEGAAGAHAAKGGIKAFLPLIIALVAMPALAYATTMFLILPKLKKDLGITAQAAEGGEHGEGASDGHGATGTKESVPMTKLLVNVAGTMGQRYLLVSLTLVGSDPKMRDKLKEFDAQLRDMACGSLATKTLSDLEKPGSRNLIRAELMSGFNNILGSAMVQEIYMTEFAIQ